MFSNWKTTDWMMIGKYDRRIATSCIIFKPLMEHPCKKFKNSNHIEWNQVLVQYTSYPTFFRAIYIGDKRGSFLLYSLCKKHFWKLPKSLVVKFWLDCNSAWVFSRFLTCTNGTKSRSVSNWYISWFAARVWQTSFPLHLSQFRYNGGNKMIAFLLKFCITFKRA